MRFVNSESGCGYFDFVFIGGVYEIANFLMAQTVVSKYYSTRKHVKEPIKSVKDAEKKKISDLLVTEVGAKAATDLKKTVKSKTKSKKVNKVTDYFKNKLETNKKTCKKEDPGKNEAPRTPKRNLSNAEELTPTKKKPPVPCSVESSPAKRISREYLTPTKSDFVACRTLQFGSPNRYASPKKLGSPLKKDEVTPQKAAMYENLTNHDLASIVNESRSKILFSGRLDELKKSLEKFSSVAAKTKEFQANSHKISSIVSAAKDSVKESKPLLQEVPAYKKFSGLAASQAESSLILPYKYKFLSETFRCLDIVVQMIHNRKERITFEKVRNGVQKMLNKNFLMSHLGQIMTVLPTAFSLSYEKLDSYTINKSTPYHLVITPNLSNVEDNSAETSDQQKKNNKNTFIYMTPQHILLRKDIFMDNLIKIVKKHHMDFLTKINFPTVEEKIMRWHPKFPLDSVPDIPVSALPEEPEMKVSTAKEVLNKIRGSVRGRVEKALQSVSEEHKNESKQKSSSENDFKKSSEIKKQNPALKGICTDLLEKIRARESAKLIESMTRSVEEEKRLAMLGRIPKIVHILWHYFISERKAAVSVDAAIEKIRHSLNSLSTPEDIKEHLQLIMEVMPGWLTLIKITRGEYLTMDKKKDITVMLDNIK